MNGHDIVLPRWARLEVYYYRMMRAPPVSDHDAAMQLMVETLNGVEDEFSVGRSALSDVKALDELQRMTFEDVKALLVDLGNYTYNVADDFLNDIPSLARVATSSVLTGKTINDAAEFHSNDPVFLSVAGASIEAIVLFIDSADESTSRLLMFQDTGVTGLPLTPDGNNVQIVVSGTGWFTL